MNCVCGHPETVHSVVAFDGRQPCLVCMGCHDHDPHAMWRCSCEHYEPDDGTQVTDSVINPKAETYDGFYAGKRWA